MICHREQAITALVPCLPFLTDPTVPSPSVTCCLSVANVNAAASTTQSHRELYEYFESMAQITVSSLRKLNSFLVYVQFMYPCSLIPLSTARRNANEPRRGVCDAATKNKT
ncbi:uncharacterized protein LOC111275237 [Durio zibethinus]|uniref:Uncharacterized protein LOC111275237 n=1 Tax=Durio zibethinus TaxID=66656 RepID=A0A6P5WJP2_DURZI|nr:uncharacterized protein LOC111275237 [Durio zibethinus]